MKKSIYFLLFFILVSAFCVSSSKAATLEKISSPSQVKYYKNVVKRNGSLYGIKINQAITTKKVKTISAVKPIVKTSPVVKIKKTEVAGVPSKPITVSSTPIVYNKNGDINLDSMKWFGKFGDFKVVKIDLAEQMASKLIKVNDATATDILIRRAQSFNTSTVINNFSDAKNIMIERYSHFPHGQISLEPGHTLDEEGFNDFNDYIFPYLNKYSQASSVKDYVKVLFIRLFHGVESDNVFKFIIYSYERSPKCAEYETGFINGFITKDSKVYIVGGGCVDDSKSSNGNSPVVTFSKNSLNGYILDFNVFGKVKMNIDSASARGFRDSKIVSDVKRIQTALEMYFMDKNIYPFGTGIATSLATYLHIYPTPPPPIDGDSGDKCDKKIKEYRYTFIPAKNTKSESSYKLEYCLSYGISGISAGVHTATPSGIK